MSDPPNLLDWEAKAEEDYRAIQPFMRRKEPVTSIACFHAQQCVEKYLKGMLDIRGKAFPKTHDLLQLRDLCEQIGILVPISEDALDRLSKFAVATRYPGSTPTLNEAKESYETAKAVRKFARKFLGVK